MIFIISSPKKSAKNLALLTTKTRLNSAKSGSQHCFLRKAPFLKKIGENRRKV
jgi:hypothetical protein